MRLSRQGYGNLEKMHNLDVRQFINLIHYENYLVDYEKVLKELNKKG